MTTEFHLYACADCGQQVDRRDLGAVAHHETPNHGPLLREADEVSLSGVFLGYTLSARCYVCKGPATCVGAYEGTTAPEFCCDEHCGHGNEDGTCRPTADPRAFGDFLRAANPDLYDATVSDFLNRIAFDEDLAAEVAAKHPETLKALARESASQAVFAAPEEDPAEVAVEVLEAKGYRFLEDLQVVPFPIVDDLAAACAPRNCWTCVHRRGGSCVAWEVSEEDGPEVRLVNDLTKDDFKDAQTFGYKIDTDERWGGMPDGTEGDCGAYRRGPLHPRKEEWAWMKDGGLHANGVFATREEALDDARDTVEEPTFVYVARPRRARFEAWAPDAEDLVEEADVRAHDNDFRSDDPVFEGRWARPAPGSPMRTSSQYRAADRDLRDLLCGWGLRWVQQDYWIIDDLSDRVLIEPNPDEGVDDLWVCLECKKEARLHVTADGGAAPVREIVCEDGHRRPRPRYLGGLTAFYKSYAEGETRAEVVEAMVEVVGFSSGSCSFLVVETSRWDEEGAWESVTVFENEWSTSAPWALIEFLKGVRAGEVVQCPGPDAGAALSKRSDVEGVDSFVEWTPSGCSAVLTCEEDAGLGCYGGSCSEGHLFRVSTEFLAQTIPGETRDEEVSQDVQVGSES